MTTKRITQVFLGLMGLAFCKVGMEALLTPQAVLANVGIVLDNASALSSMRAVYGGMHFAFGAACFWGIFKNPKLPLTILMLYTVGFVAGRLSSLMVDGAPNEFVYTWLITETVSFAISATLYGLLTRAEKHTTAIAL